MFDPKNIQQDIIKFGAPNLYGKFMVGEYNKIIGSHHRPLYGGHYDVNYVCHYRENIGGGRSSTHMGDTADFMAGNYSCHVSGSHVHEVAGNQRTRVNGDLSHSTHDPDGNMMAIVSHTQDNSWMNNIGGNVNINSGNMPQMPPKAECNDYVSREYNAYEWSRS